MQIFGYALDTNGIQSEKNRFARPVKVKSFTNVIAVKLIMSKVQDCSRFMPRFSEKENALFTFQSDATFKWAANHVSCRRPFFNF